jgi:hypothetical protein
MRQKCKACGVEDKFNFDVPDAIWIAVVPLELRCRVVCLSCFDEFARKNSVDYAASLRAVFFAGEAAAFEFQPIARTALEASGSSAGPL